MVKFYSIDDSFFSPIERQKPVEKDDTKSSTKEPDKKDDTPPKQIVPPKPKEVVVKTVETSDAEISDAENSDVDNNDSDEKTSDSKDRNQSTNEPTSVTENETGKHGKKSKEK
jgi:hypothetical protein